MTRLFSGYRWLDTDLCFSQRMVVVQRDSVSHPPTPQRGLSQSDAEDAETVKVYIPLEPELEAAYRLLKKVVHYMEESKKDKEDKETALFTCQLASLHMLRHEQAEAYSLLHVCLPVLQKHLGESHPEVRFTFYFVLWWCTMACSPIHTAITARRSYMPSVTTVRRVST